MKITERPCKTALSRSGIYGWEYALNPYRGCEHACRYCYVPNILRLERATWGTFLEVKKNVPVVLAKELKRLTPGLVGVSSVTDPYQRTEEKYELTRYCLEQLLRYKFPVSIITKSPLILRDIDLLKRFSYSEITVTITTLEDRVSKILEPHAPAISKRLEALTELSSQGLNTYAFLGPLYPTLEHDMVPGFVEKIEATGVKTIMVDTLNLRPGIWPEVEGALKSVPEIKNIFYERLFKDKEYYPTIFELIKNECNNRMMNFE